jgi:hypothetical protein
VNGRADGNPVTVGFTPFHAGGPLTIGQALSAGAGTDYWPGDIDEVRVWDRLIFEHDASDLAEVPVMIGSWNLDEGSGKVAVDSAGVRPDHAASLTSGATWANVDPDDARPADGNGADPGLPAGKYAAEFNGASGRAITNGPVLRTDQSYTVAAWVRLTDTGYYRVAVAQEGAHTSAFFLQYNQATNRWAMGASAADADSSPLTRAESTTAPVVGQWTHLVGVYDEVNQKLRLYVNGVLQSSVDYKTAWQATGALSIGEGNYNSKLGSFWDGDLAEVKTYSGVLSDNEIRDLAGL